MRDKTHANIMLAVRLGSFQINLQFCWPSPMRVLSTWYIFATMWRAQIVSTGIWALADAGSATHILPTFSTHARLADDLYCMPLDVLRRFASFMTHAAVGGCPRARAPPHGGARPTRRSSASTAELLGNLLHGGAPPPAPDPAASRRRGGGGGDGHHRPPLRPRRCPRREALDVAPPPGPLAMPAAAFERRFAGTLVAAVVAAASGSAAPNADLLAASSAAPGSRGGRACAPA